MRIFTFSMLVYGLLASTASGQANVVNITLATNSNQIATQSQGNVFVRVYLSKPNGTYDTGTYRIVVNMGTLAAGVFTASNPAWFPQNFTTGVGITSIAAPLSAGAATWNLPGNPGVPGSGYQFSITWMLINNKWVQQAPDRAMSAALQDDQGNFGPNFITVKEAPVLLP
jgi:hypothetical protein